MGDELTHGIIVAAIEVDRILGSGLLESIHEEALCIEFELRGIRFARQAEVQMTCNGRGVIKPQRIDLRVEAEVVVKLKAVRELPEVAVAEVLLYLKSPALKRALLINFSQARLVGGVKRISL